MFLRYISFLSQIAIFVFADSARASTHRLGITKPKEGYVNMFIILLIHYEYASCDMTFFY